MSKPLNHERRIRQMLTKPVSNVGSPARLALTLRTGGGRHTDRKKDASRKACRGRAAVDA